jgi:hypothetical protein
MNNIYPSWWNKDITLFNRYVDKQTKLISWHRHHLSGAFFGETGTKMVIDRISIDTGNYLCRIRKDPRYRTKAQWITLPNDVMDSFFTLDVGDIIVLGHVDTDINEQLSGHRQNDVLKNLRDNGIPCFVVEKKRDNTGGGRFAEHYYAEGK